MPSPRRTVLSRLSTHRGSICAVISLVVFALTTATLIRSFLAYEHAYWTSRSHPVESGPIGAWAVTLEGALSRGGVGLYFERCDWFNDPVREPQWSIDSVPPGNSLVFPQSEFDRTNVEFAGFQWVHKTTETRPSNVATIDVYFLLLPLWPLLIASAVPPWLWWRRRRKLGARGFPVSAVAEPGGSTRVE